MKKAPPEGGGAKGSGAGSGAGAGKIDLQPVRGARDFPPPEARRQQWLFERWRKAALACGFEEVDFPVLETEALYARKAGEEISEQLYGFEDKSGRRVALRPELTPSLARLALQSGRALPLPAKWFVIGQCWRYERTTRGRRREHYQWNMDVLGAPGPEAEAELIAAAVAFMEGVGLTSADVGIRVSSRAALQALLEACGVPPGSLAAAFVVVDKAEKLPRDAVVAELGALGVGPAAADRVLAALECRSLDALEELLAGVEAEAAGVGGGGAAAGGAASEPSEARRAVAHLRELFALAEGHGCRDWLEFDASVVRGLAYYTGTVFEGFDRAGELRALFGGGRYDRLLSTFGGDDVPAVGFGFGDAVIVELLKERGLLPELPQQVDDVVVAREEGLGAAAAEVAARLRAAGRRVDLVFGVRKMKWVFRQAERVGAARLLLVGAEEWGRGGVRVRCLETREEAEVPLEEALKAP